MNTNKLQPEGLTLRDYFVAMGAIITSTKTTDMRFIAAQAYTIADEMLAKRQ
jgi:hypothetical protein